MIIKIDHIALSSLSFKDDIKLLKSLGYNLVILEENIENLSQKESLLSIFHKRHNLALLTSNLNYDIELLDHGQLTSNRGYIIPFFENIPPNVIRDTGHERVINGTEYKEEIIRSMNILFYTQNLARQNDFKFNKLIVESTDINKSIEFWKCLGFKVLTSGEQNCLEFKSIFDNESYYIIVNKSNNKEVQRHFLDDIGFNCMAFVTNSAQHEKEKLNEKGIKTTEIEQLRVNEKLLNIFFALGPSGEIVEIIELIRE
nr:VOC family protein [uncultured Methanolobus sp.]